MKRVLVLLLGVALIVGGLLGASLTLTEVGKARAQGGMSQMHEMMDPMMGTGAAKRMQAAMPGSEAMMTACAGRMGDMMSGGMQGMPMDGMRDGSE